MNIVFSVEFIGTIASAIILLSFMLENDRKIRLVNILGCIVYIVYGIMISSFSIIFLNIMLIIVHINKLLKNRNRREKNENF